MYFLILFLTLIGTCFYWIFNKLSYWKTIGVKQDNASYIFLNIFRQIVKQEGLVKMVKEFYVNNSDIRYYGQYQFFSPLFTVQNPDLIKKITVKDFDHFVDHVPFIPDEIDPLWTRNLVSLNGDKWRNMRTTLSPAFTSSKMKAMFVLMSECAEDFTNYFVENPNATTVEFKDIFTRYANDVIATCGFGLKCDSIRERDNKFYLMAKEATDFTGIRKNLEMFLLMITPFFGKWFGFRMFNQRVSDFFTKIVSDTIKLREEKNIIRPDMIHLLMQARKGGLSYEEVGDSSKDTGFATVEESDLTKSATMIKQEITDIDITAQCLIFFFAGFETVSTLMCFMAYELGINPDIQEKLIIEIDEALENCNGKLNYDVLNKMKYMDMVIAETLRKWPASLVSDRLCVKSYDIPAENSNESDINIPKGTAMWIPIFGIHRDPKFYSNPEKFDPERFSEENKDDIKPYTYLPFGAGPRNCIGSRFALLETKTIMFYLLSKFNIKVIAKSPIPMKLLNRGFSLNSENGFWFKLDQRKK